MEPENAADISSILVVEDDVGTRTLLLRFLQENGYRVTGARNGTEMWDTLRRLPIDLILLDIMLPGTTGLDLCRTIRQDNNTVPIIMLTARGSETDRVLGLELGADDYLSKPFSRPELLARIRAVLRRGRVLVKESPSFSRRYFRFAGWKLDTARRELLAPAGEAVELSAAEFDVLLAFLEHPQRILTRDRILELSRSRRGEVFDRSVDVLVSRLRRKLEHQEVDETAPGLIKTLRGAGYMFVPDVFRE